jgi:hypothetical protein
MRKIPYAWLLWVPLLLIFSGILSNQICLISNHDRFPVMVNARKMAGMVQPVKHTKLPFAFNTSITHQEIEAAPKDLGPDGMLDTIHCLMVPGSHLKALADIFDFGISTMSIGDLLISLGEWLLTITPIMWLTLILRKLWE